MPVKTRRVAVTPISCRTTTSNAAVTRICRKFSDVNLHTYHYAGNNPVKLADPDGRKIVVSGTRKERNEILNRINSVSSNQYKLKKIDGAYMLVTTGKTNQNNSKENANTLNTTINDPNLVIVHGADASLGGSSNGISAMFDAPDELTSELDIGISFEIHLQNTSIVSNVNYQFEVDGKKKKMLVSFMVITLEADNILGSTTSGDEIVGNLKTFVLPIMSDNRDINNE
jgi:hypothetical protein